MRSDYSVAKHRLKGLDNTIKENSRLLSMVDLAKNDGFMLEIEKLKKEVSKLKDENWKLKCENGSIHREIHQLKIEKEKSQTKTES